MANRPSSPNRARRPRSNAGDVSDGVAAVGDPEPVREPVPEPAPEHAPEPEVFGDEDTDDDGGAAALAARRRSERGGTPPPMPGERPAGEGDGGGEIIVSRTLMGGFTQGSPVRPTGGVWAGKPIVLENSPHAPTGVGETSDYVVAAVSATESMVMPGCRTPVSRIAWHAGMRVRRDVYEAAIAEHERRVAEGNAGEPVPAQLPEGVSAVPASAVRQTPIPSPAGVLAAGPGRVESNPDSGPV